MSINIKDLAVRVVKTFGQAYAAFLTLSGFGVSDLTNWGAGKKLLIAAAISAATVVWNVVLVPLWAPTKSAVKAVLK